MSNGNAVSLQDLMRQMQAMQAELSATKAELAAAKSAPSRKITLKVGEKGTLCVYHGGRYPISLYRSQWERLLPFFKSGEVEAFIETNAALLATRPVTA